ncbi:MAG: hypothetical protein QOI20_731 [Acidimicrobiaceae bacterium]|nr:hypothetical protein [Acidimicrobiaceae bacterium]
MTPVTERLRALPGGPTKRRMPDMCRAGYEDTHHGFVRHAQRVAAILVVGLAVWALTGAGVFWPGWVALILGVKLAAHARRVYSGGRSDADLDIADDDNVDQALVHRDQFEDEFEIV